MKKKVVLQNLKKQKIVGILNIPKIKPPYPAVIICHGFKGYKEQMHLQSLASQLAQNGILAFRFDFGNGLGESYGQLEDISFGQYLDDLKTVVNYLAKQKFVDKKRIGLAGHSLGGQLILHYAPIDKRIKVLADLAGVIYHGLGDTGIEKILKKQSINIEKDSHFFVFSKSKKKKFKVKINFYFELVNCNTAKKIKQIKVPTLIIHGSRDESVPLSHSRLVYRLVKGQKKMTIIPGAPHTWRQPKYYKKINPIVVDWFKKYL